MIKGEKDVSAADKAGEEWMGVAEWARAVNESADEREELEWRSFLGRGLYNLDRLNRPKESDA